MPTMHHSMQWPEVKESGPRRQGHSLIAIWRQMHLWEPGLPASEGRARRRQVTGPWPVPFAALGRIMK